MRGEGTKNFYPNLSPLFYPCSSVFIYVQFGYLRNSLAAIRAIPEARRDWLAALGAGLGRTELDGAHLGMPGFIEDAAAAAAFNEGLSPLNRDQRDEKKAYILVQSFEPGRG